MTQKRIAGILRFFSVMAGIIGGLFFFWFMPMCIDDIVSLEPAIAFLRWPGKITMWVMACVCYYALYRFFRVCDHIENENSFCHDNVMNMKMIGNVALIVTGMILLGDIYLLCVGWLHLGFLIVSLVFVFIAASFAVVSYALSFLIENAVKIKEENELTI